MSFRESVKYLSSCELPSPLPVFGLVVLLDFVAAVFDAAVLVLAITLHFNLLVTEIIISKSEFKCCARAAVCGLPNLKSEQRDLPA